MEAAQSLKPSELSEFLLNVAPVRPVFIWGPPGIGKSALVERFAASVGMTCVSMLGSQLAPEDIIGVPRIEDGVSTFCPPAQIARKEPYCLFLDELNACSQEVQKAFYSLINDRRIGAFELPKGSVVIGAGNRAQDAAIVKPISSALINRMAHVQLRADVKDWMAWAGEAGIHPLILDYIQLRADHLWSKPPKHEEPFSTPRAWHILSDAMQSYDPANLSEAVINTLASGLLTPAHARQFVAFYRQSLRAFDLTAILKGEKGWPEAPDERDILYFLVQSFRARLIKELPDDAKKLNGEAKTLALSAKDRLIQLSRISLEMAQLVVAEEEDGTALPDWFMVEIARDLPRLVSGRS
ncbi:MAG: AAA family ATPase [Rhodospirillaceae bacterium]